VRTGSSEPIVGRERGKGRIVGKENVTATLARASRVLAVQEVSPTQDDSVPVRGKSEARGKGGRKKALPVLWSSKEARKDRDKRSGIETVLRFRREHHRKRGKSGPCTSQNGTNVGLKPKDA